MSHAQLRIWPALAGPRIAPTLYGHQLEMVGRSIYDGIWVDRSSRIPNEDGFRLDVLTLMKHLRVPLLKWPGDAFANYYHWEDGVGTGGERPHRVNIPWQQIEPNAFGFHEFMGLCNKLECKPWVTCNGQSGTLDEALAWVEYATFGGDTARTSARRDAGHLDPYEVPLWSVGPGADWDLSSLEVLNPDLCKIERFESVIDGKGVCDGALSEFTSDQKKRILSISHFFSQAAPEIIGKDRHDSYCVGLHRFESKLRRCAAEMVARFGLNGPKIALSEWGVWHGEASSENGLEQRNTLSDALVAASMFNLLNDHAEHVTHAVMAQAINALQCLVVTEGPDMFLTPNYHVVDMMAPHRGARRLCHRVDTPEMEVAETPGGPKAKIPTLSVSASRVGKRVCVTVVNRSYGETIPVSVEIREAGIAGVTGRLLHAESVTSENSAEMPKNVTPQWLNLSPDGNTFHDTLPPHSFAAYNVTLGQG